MHDCICYTTKAYTFVIGESHVWPHVCHLRRMKVASNGLICKYLKEKYRDLKKHFRHFNFRRSHFTWDSQKYVFSVKYRLFSIAVIQAILINYCFAHMDHRRPHMPFTNTEVSRKHIYYLRLKSNCRQNAVSIIPNKCHDNYFGAISS